jgi:FkbM family methyltransferase
MRDPAGPSDGAVTPFPSEPIANESGRGPLRSVAMSTKIRSAAKSALGRLGLQKRSTLPFGTYWEDDVWALSDGRSNLTCVDVGANIGQTAQKLVTRFPGASIYSFEPVPATFAQLKLNTASFPGIECFNFALGESAGEALITTDRKGQNSLLSGVTSEGKTTVQIRTLDDFCSENRIDHIDLLKIDTEGFETSVLRGGRRMLSEGRIDFVVAECDFIPRPDEPHGDFFEIHDLLSQGGFRVVGFYNGGVDGRGWVWGDVLMMREGRANPRVRVRPLEP